MKPPVSFSLFYLFLLQINNNCFGRVFRPRVLNEANVPENVFVLSRSRATKRPSIRDFLLGPCRRNLKACRNAVDGDKPPYAQWFQEVNAIQNDGLQKDVSKVVQVCKAVNLERFFEESRRYQLSMSLQDIRTMRARAQSNIEGILQGKSNAAKDSMTDLESTIDLFSGDPDSPFSVLVRSLALPVRTLLSLSPESPSLQAAAALAFWVFLPFILVVMVIGGTISVAVTGVTMLAVRGILAILRLIGLSRFCAQDYLQCEYERYISTVVPSLIQAAYVSEADDSSGLP